MGGGGGMRFGRRRGLLPARRSGMYTGLGPRRAGRVMLCRPGLMLGRPAVERLFRPVLLLCRPVLTLCRLVMLVRPVVLPPPPPPLCRPAVLLR